MTGSESYKPSKKKGAVIGVKRWFFYQPLSLSRIAFIFQRITGVGITIFFIIHVFTIGIYFKPYNWVPFLYTVETPIMWIGEMILLSAIGFHVVNGLRLTISEFGFTIGKPTRPDFPYNIQSLNIYQKAVIITSIIIGIFFALIGFLFIFQGI